MNNNKEFDLLSDLAKLIKKYGPGPFEALSEQLRNPRFTGTLIDVLNTTAGTYRTLPRAKGRSRSRTPNSEFLTSLNRYDAERFALLVDLYDALKNKSILPTLREMKDFASDNGLPPIKAKSREKALVPFVRIFLKMPIEEVREYLRRIQPTRISGDRTLEGWSQVIFGNDAEGSRRK
jgi:hypothetical protein